MTQSTTSSLQQNQMVGDEIDLRQVTGAIVRHRWLIVKLTAATVLISGIYALLRQPVWEGQFQIVLEAPENKSGGRLAQIAAANPMLAGLAGVSLGENALETEVQILKSPSVLKPTYEFVKATKFAAGIDVSEWVYTDWTKDNLSISLLKDTTVLSLAYRDTDKSLILPVLEQISRTYQEYSGKDRRRGLTQGVNHLEQEINKLRNQSTSSMRAAQSYALTNGLGIQDGIPTTAGLTGTRNGISNVSVEASREEVQNKVNALRQRIASAEKLDNTTLYKAPQLEANIEIYSKLQRLESLLQQKSALLTPEDPSILRLQRERNGLITYINQQTVGLLQGELKTAEAHLASLTRPREVVLKHRELMRAALRDEKILAELEVQLQGLKLDQARQTEPWELISTPTLLEKPIGPSKARIVAVGLFAGLVLGCSAALIKDRRSGLVFSDDELKALIPSPLLEHIEFNDSKKLKDSVQLLADGPLANARSIGLLLIGEIPKKHIEFFSVALRNALGKRSLVVSRDLLETRDCNIQLLITCPGAVKRRQLLKFREQVALQATPLAGWLSINSTSRAEN